LCSNYTSHFKKRILCIIFFFFFHLELRKGYFGLSIDKKNKKKLQTRVALTSVCEVPFCLRATRSALHSSQKIPSKVFFVSSQWSQQGGTCELIHVALVLICSFFSFSSFSFLDCILVMQKIIPALHFVFLIQSLFF
jgi:hypothetical protein